MDPLQGFVEDNRKERERLKALLASLEKGDFERRLSNGWTVSVALAHLAFWDLRQAVLLKRWMEQGIRPEGIDAEAVNDPLAVLCEALPPKAVVRETAEAAEAVDLLVEKLTPAQAEELLKLGFERNLHRAVHRRRHLDAIERLLRRIA